MARLADRKNELLLLLLLQLEMMMEAMCFVHMLMAVILARKRSNRPRIS